MVQLQRSPQAGQIVLDENEWYGRRDGRYVRCADMYASAAPRSSPSMRALGILPPRPAGYTP